VCFVFTVQRGWEYEAKILITNKTANTAENIAFARTFRPSSDTIVHAKDEAHIKLSNAIIA